MTSPRRHLYVQFVEALRVFNECLCAVDPQNFLIGSEENVKCPWKGRQFAIFGEAANGLDVPAHATINR